MAVAQTGAQKLRGDVDKLNLIGGTYYLVRHRFLRRDARDLLDNVVKTLQMLDIESRHNVYSGL